MTSGNRAGNMDYADVCAAQALTGMLPRWIGFELYNRGHMNLDDARKSLHRMCGWATLAGAQMEALRTAKKRDGTIPMPTQRGADEKDAVEDNLPDEPDNAAGS